MILEPAFERIFKTILLGNHFDASSLRIIFRNENMGACNTHLRLCGDWDYGIDLIAMGSPFGMRGTEALLVESNGDAYSVVSFSNGAK